MRDSVVLTQEDTLLLQGLEGRRGGSIVVISVLEPYLPKNVGRKGNNEASGRETHITGSEGPYLDEPVKNLSWNDLLLG